VFLDELFGLFLGWKKPARSFAGFRFLRRDLDAPVVSGGIEKRGHYFSDHCCALLRKKQSEMADLATFVQDRGYLKSDIQARADPLFKRFARRIGYGDPNGIRTRVTAVKGRYNKYISRSL
jgi:hypothetical protein